jgi:hypothetical protein
MVQISFNPSEAKSMDEIGFDPIPAGQYKAIVTEADAVVPKSGDGSMIKMKLQIVEGEHKDRLLFENLCVEHSKQKVAEIAQARLRQYCEAMNLSVLNDTEQLLNKPVLVTIKVTPPRDGFDAGNSVTRVEATQAPKATGSAATAKQRLKEDKGNPWGAK